MNSKQKGKRGELELAKKLKEYGFSDTHRTVQYNGKADDSKADLCGLPGIHVECKRVEKLNIDSAMGQAIRDHSEGEMPVVFHRKSRKPASSENRNGRYSKDHHIVHKKLAVEKSQTDA